MEATNFCFKSCFKFFVLFLLIIHGNSGFSAGTKNWIILEYTNGNDSLPEKAKEIAYYEYLRCMEDNMVYFQFKNPQNYSIRTSYVECQKLCAELSNFFVKKGVSKENLTIKNAPEAHLIVYKKPGISVNANFVSLPEKWKQKFVLSNQKGGEFETKNGHKIVFPPNSFQTIKGDSVRLEFYEIDSQKKFVESGYTASSSDKLLESNGMFKITATQNNQVLKMKEGVQAEIRFKKNNFENANEKSTYNTFYGTENNNEVDWQPNLNQKVENSPGCFDDVSTNKSSYKETHYVQLCYNIAFLEAALASRITNCKLNEKDYNFLVSKYGILMFIENNNYHEIKTYQSYLSHLTSHFDMIYIGLSKAQNDKLLLDVEAKRIADEKAKEEKRIADEIAREKQRLDDEKAYEAERLAAQKAKEVEDKYPISMKMNQLGNINCDRFYNMPIKTDIIVIIDDTDFDQIKVYAIFSGIKSVIHGVYLPTDKGNITFHQLPQGENVIYSVAIYKGSKLKMAYTNKSILAKDVVKLSLVNYTSQQCEKILDELMPE